MFIGGAFGSMLTGWLLVPMGRLLDGVGPLTAKDGWHSVFALFALPGLAWAVVLLVVPQSPRRPSQRQPGRIGHACQGSPAGKGGRIVGGAVVAHPDQRAAAAAVHPAGVPGRGESDVRLAPADVLGGGALPRETQKERDAAKATAATLASLPQWAGVFGGVIGGAPVRLGATPHQ